MQNMKLDFPWKASERCKTTEHLLSKHLQLEDKTTVCESKDEEKEKKKQRRDEAVQEKIRWHAKAAAAQSYRATKLENLSVKPDSLKDGFKDIANEATLLRWTRASRSELQSVSQSTGACSATWAILSCSSRELRRRSSIWTSTNGT
eukprot:TRINITY_DN35196_c0_g1_i1.p1 TRINITY_DN35196_c0_g1~~TRINITY_DN35196_c0_g1_i1.p1  ORF type:complete len:147 (-),score=29.49 TRINITY_DN35196_c0_g1_i1:16-456(-)